MTPGLANRGQPLDPFLMRVDLLAFERIDRLANKFAAIGNDAELDVAIASDFLGLDIDLDDARVGRNHRVAPAGEHSDAGAEHDHQIGAATAGLAMRRGMNRAEAAEVQRMLLRDRAARFRIGHHRRMREFRAVGSVRRPAKTTRRRRRESRDAWPRAAS